MNTRESARLANETLPALWPQWPAEHRTPLLMLEYVDLFAHDWLTVARANEAIRRHLRAWRGQSPSVACLKAEIDAERIAHFREVAAARAAESRQDEDHDSKSLAEWKRHYTTTPEGRAAWECLKPNVRRGLSRLFRLGSEFMERKA